MTRERTTLTFEDPPEGFVVADSTVTTGNTQVGVDAATDQLVSYEANSTGTLPGFPNVANLEPTDPTINRERDTAAFVNSDRDTLYIATEATQAYEIATGSELTAPSLDVHGWVFTVTEATRSLHPTPTAMIRS